MVKIKLFDVDHGFCAGIELDEHHIMLLDCGYSFRTGFRPARYLLNHPSRHIDYLVIPAYTKEHLTGFSDLSSHVSEHYFSIDCLIANPSINAANLPELMIRNPGTGSTLKQLSNVLRQQRKINQFIDWQNCKLSFFWNSYPDFLDIRNLSLVTFFSYQDMHIIFPGDLKVEGWRNLLKNAEFCDRLRQVNLLVASNHGQEDGCCPEVFNYCKPDLVIISNHLHRRLPPAAIRQYEHHAHGIETDLGRQKVLTTRDAGTITIQTIPNNPIEISTQQSKRNQVQQAEVYQT